VRNDLGEKLKELIPRMRRFACGLTGSIDSGDELVQAACERLLNHHARLKPDTRLDSWLYQVIRNLHIDGIRAQAVRQRGAEKIRQDLVLVAGSESNLDNHLQLHEVQDALGKLPEEQRAALMLVCVEGLSYKEAAEVLGVPMGTVTSRLVRGRSALIAQMEGGGAAPQQTKASK
jgi:RNA polymerase sigma-70 factor (ECF subfamily)